MDGADERRAERRMLEEIDTLWRTAPLRAEKPTPVDEVRAIMTELESMPEKIQQVLDGIEPVHELARQMARKDGAVFFLGRHVGYPVALEGALKLKEIAYMHAEGFAAGELKHGPIAVIEQDTPVFVIVPPAGRD